MTTITKVHKWQFAPSLSATSPVTQRMAKVVVSLSAGAGVDRHEVEQTRIYIFGFSQGFLDNRSNVLQGWDNKWIAVNGTPPAPCSLLLIPQDMSGQEFIRIVTPRRRFCFMAPPGMSCLRGGCTYYYSVKMNADEPYFSLSYFSCTEVEND